MNNQSKKLESIKFDDLKGYREQSKISLEDAADGMKVSKDYIHYIEAGQFEKLGAPTFLRGHITNYCKVLGIDPQLVLSEVPSQYLQYQQIKTSDAMGASPLARVKRQSNHLGRYAVGTTLLGMLCLSFYFIWDKWSVPRDRQAIESIALNSENKTDKKITYSSLIPQVTGVESTIDSSTTDEVTDDVVLEEPILLPENSTQSLDLDEAESDKEIDLLEAAGDEDSEPQDNIISSIYTIKMQLDEQAWVSIKTQDGTKIVHDLIGPGLREYHVDQPVHFRMGNVDNLHLTINDSQVELSQFSDQDIADFDWPLNPSS